ncbi:hypothetical protein [Guptibacillus hwajinpoensis]|uniref:hypothetical protein n=1 Tax=Guptibacillus hwajinpoensis TaxID=208199 RepID=UPI001CFEC952|nr:hypothetical protein [Pseudalkalibacillus hwajinpoensis]WLR59063.1 hypothetical protein LC071_18215 [Pseudalkalibacillus hwajinpoensis]
MKKQVKLFYCHMSLLLFILLLVGCSDGTNAKSNAAESDATLSTEETTEVEEGNQANEASSSSMSEDTSQEDAKESTSEEAKSGESNPADENEENHALDDYSSKEIEYARVWSQLGPNQEIDELNVQLITAGTPLDPDDENSLTYPEDVVQLRGSRIVDGIVTYSGNGDGTINVYNVPLRWYGGFPPPEDIDKEEIQKEMEEIITNTKLVNVDTGDNEKIIEIINKMNSQ